MSTQRNKSQMQLIQLDVSQYMKANHWSLILNEIFEQMDFSKLEWKKTKNATKQEPYEAELLAKLWLSGYFYRVRSCRKLAQLCEDNIGCIFFLQNAKSPCKSTLNDFRKQNLDELAKLLAHTVIIAKELGLIKGNIFIDGTKIKADASYKNRIDKNKLSKELEELTEKCKEYLSSIEDSTDDADKDILNRKINNLNERKTTIIDNLSLLNSLNVDKLNTSDMDSILVKDNDQYYDGYNAQVATDNQIIICADVVAEPNDYYQLEPMVNKCLNIENYDPESVTADSGYENSEHLSSLEDKIDILVVPQTPENTSYKYKYFTTTDFKYNLKKDVFICPNNMELTYYRDKNKTNKNGTLVLKNVYKAIQSDCKICPIKDKCFGGNKSRRELVIRHDFQIINKNTEKARSKIGKTRLKKRSMDVEAVFGAMKGYDGILSFLLVGLEKVKCEWSLLCIGHNLRKIVSSKIKKTVILVKLLHYFSLFLKYYPKLSKICTKNRFESIIDKV